MTIENVMHNTLWFVKYTNTYQGVKCIDKITPIIYCIYNMHTYVCIKLIELCFLLKELQAEKKEKGRM